MNAIGRITVDRGHAGNQDRAIGVAGQPDVDAVAIVFRIRATIVEVAVDGGARPVNRHGRIGDAGQVEEQPVTVVVAEVAGDAQDRRVDGTNVEIQGTERVGGELIGSRHQQVGFGSRIIGIEVQPVSTVTRGRCRVEADDERRAVVRIELETVVRVVVGRIGAEQEAGRGCGVEGTGSGHGRIDAVEGSRRSVARVRRDLRAVIEDAQIGHIDQQSLAAVVVEDRGVDSELPQ